MSGSLVADLGIGPGIWLFLSLVSILTVFFKFHRFWSVRNLDLVLLFALGPAMVRLVGGQREPWGAFAWMFVGSTLWLVRCLADLGLSRRPLLEPNLNAAGLGCLALGVLSLLVAETISLPVREGEARNPADAHTRHGATLDRPPPGSADVHAAVDQVLRQAPLPVALRRNPPQVILSRILAVLGHLGLVATLIAIGTRHFGRPILGMAVATSYVLLPYTRIALVDSGQVVPAALIATALLLYLRPTAAGALIGLAAGWMPACLGLIPLWAGFYGRRGAWRFLLGSLAIVAACGVVAWLVPGVAAWSRALGARSLTNAGLWPGAEPPASGSFWSGIDPSFRLPVLIGYLALVVLTTAWPAGKNLGELIALSAALLIASQYWYLDAGGTQVVLYLPLILLMMFRPNLASKRPAPLREGRLSHSSAVPDL